MRGGPRSCNVHRQVESTDAASTSTGEGPTAVHQVRLQYGPSAGSQANALQASLMARRGGSRWSSAGRAVAAWRRPCRLA
jgi:hypothetical protein